MIRNIIKPISTSIRQVVRLGEHFIIREDHYEFKGRSNIYCLNNDEVIWYAELPSEDDVYSNEIKVTENDTLKTSSWNGFTVEIDIENGKILEKYFTK